MGSESVSRRQFIRKAGGYAAGILFITNSHRVFGANERPVLGFMGSGGRGSYLADHFCTRGDCDITWIADPDMNRVTPVVDAVAKKLGRAPQGTQDFRHILDDDEVDGLIITTPDHWHALGTIMACQAGKDVYVEKPTSHNTWEGRQMVDAARKYERIVQVGTQNRSAPYGASAREYLKSGRLGKVVHVKVYNMLAGGPFRPQPDGNPPPGLNWDLWLGPAPERPFNPGRLNWYVWWDYCGGTLSGDAIHQLDLARMALGDPPHPRAAYGAGGRLAFDDRHEMPDTEIITYDYGTFTMTCENGTFSPYLKKIPPEIRFSDKFPNWPTTGTRIEIYGTQRLMYLGRHGGGWQVLDESGRIVDQDPGYFPDKWHQPNFIECIRTRRRPNADIEQAHLSACLVHLGNLACRTGNQRLVFDAKTETFAGNEAANRFLKPAYRKGYQVPEEV